MEKQFYLLLLLLCPGSLLNGQVTLSGALSGSYATLTLAFNAINAGGGSGAVTATITANHTLTSTASLNQTNYTVTVVPSGLRTVSGNMNTPLVTLNGADNTTIDGMNTATNKLTFSNSSTGLAASAIQLQADASNNMVKNCILEGSSTGQFDNGVLNIKGVSGSTGCDNNTIMGNEIKPAGTNLPRNAICMAGLNGAVLNNNTTISNNNIRDFFTPNTYSVGFFSVQYNHGTQITGNSFYQTATRTGSGTDLINRPIEVDDGFYSTSSGGFVISANFIGGTAPLCAGSAYTINHPTTAAWFEGIYIEGGPAAVNNIQGNTIQNISTSSVFGTGGNWDAFTGIDLRGSGSYNVGTTTGNTIGSATGNGSIALIQNFTSSATTHTNLIRNIATGTVSIKNNTLGSITTTMTGTLGYVSFYGIYSTNTDNVTIELNTVGGTTANSIQFAPNAQHDASLHGIMIENRSGSILNNTVQNLTSNARVELNGIFLWNNIAGKTQTCTGNTVKNLSTTTGDGLDMTGILAVSNSAASITYTLNINNNTIMDCTVGAGSTGECDLNGIWVVRRGTSPVCYVNGSISGNTIYNMTNQNTFSSAWANGILYYQLYNGTGMSISNNNINNFSTFCGNGFTGIFAFGNVNSALLPGATILNISGNTIHTMTNNFAGSTFDVAIPFNGKNISVTKNKIYNLKSLNATAGSVLAGASFDGGTNTGDYSLSNNMISIGEGVTNDLILQGIRHDVAPANSLTLLYNSVFIGGTAPGGATNRTACFDRQVTTSTTSKNNIFYNARTGGTGGHFAIANTASPPATGWSATASDYNYLVSDAASIGLWGAASQTFAGWKTASGGDSHSVSRIAGLETNPANFFVNTGTGDLSINTANPGEALFASNAGIPVAVTVDFFGTARSVSNPDIGAHEFADVCAAYAGDDVTFCIGQSTQLNSLPSAAQSYAWSPATGLNNPNIQNPVASPSSTTTYTVTTTFAGGCTATDAVTVTVNAVSAAITPGSPPTFCEGGSVTLTASGGISYLWSTGAMTAAITTATSGVYSVTVTGANGCTGTASQVVTVLPVPTAAISPGGPTTFCEGGSVVLTASGGNTYLWSTGAMTAAITVSTGGTYTVTATAANGCTDTESQTVTVLPSPPAAISPNGPTTFCEGGSVILTASGGLFYLWNTGATSAAIAASTSGTYTVIVTGANGCTATTSQSVTVLPLPNAAITPGGATTFCAGGSVTLTASGGGTYLWSTGATTAAITVNTSGTYVVTVTNTFGCTATASQVVTVNPNPTAAITPNGPTTFCAEGSVTLTASGGGTYLWSTGATTAAITVNTSGTYVVTVTNTFGCTATASQVVTVNPNPTAAITPNGPTTFCADGSVVLTASGGGTYLWSTGATTAAITVTASGTYTVTVTNANNCIATASQVVTVNPLPNAVITPNGPTTFCAGGSVVLTASGGTSYLWSSNETTAAITASASGTYLVTVTGANGCTTTASQSVTVLPLPTAAITPGGATTFCAGGSVTLTASGGGTYSWSTSATTAAITASASGTYLVTVTGANGCTATASQSVTVLPLPTAAITPGGATTFCAGGSVTLTASGGGTYSWSTSATTAAITASASGTYLVTVTGANGCTATASQSVTVLPLPTAAITPGGATTFCAGGSVTLTASGGGTYSWSTSATTAAITASASGTYLVTVTGANGCTATASQSVTVLPLPTAAITPGGATTFCAGGSVVLTASGGGTYSWSTSATTAAITASASGTYLVTVTGANGCTATASQSVTELSSQNTWTGAGDGINWSDPTNWSDGVVPFACQDVVIPAGSTVTIPAGFTAVGKTLDVLAGAVLLVNTTATLDIMN